MILFDNTIKIVQYIVAWVFFALIQAFAFAWLVTIPFWILLIDSAIHSLLFGTIGILLWNLVRFGNFSALSAYQRFVNHTALIIISIAFWLGAGYGIFLLLFGAEITSQFLPLFPIRTLIGLLIYIIIMQMINNIDEPKVLVVDELEPINSIPETDALERITVKSGTKIHVVLLAEIFYLQADGDYVQIFTTNGKFLKEQTMKFFEENLPRNKFVRVHRSTIVNVEMISRIELYEKQSQQLTLKNGQQIKTSPAGYKLLRSALNL
jgi:hypothetical protein